MKTEILDIFQQPIVVIAFICYIDGKGGTFTRLAYCLFYFTTKHYIAGAYVEYKESQQ